MICINPNCNSARIVAVMGKCSELFNVENRSGVGRYDGYVPIDLGIGGEDYIEFSHCLECGQIQGKFPLPHADIEE